MRPLHATLSLVVVLWLLTFFALDLVAQPMSGNARLIGMAGAGVSLQDGVDALGVNPAQIDGPKPRIVSIALAPFNLQAGTDFIDMATYKRYFTGVPDVKGRIPYTLTEADKQVLLSSFSDGLGTIRTDGAFTLFAVTATTPFVSFGVSMTDRITNTMLLPREYADFLLNGNTPGTTFDFSETRMTAAWTRSYGLTLAKRFPLLPFRKTTLSVGATARLVHGYGYFSIDGFDTRFTTDPDSFVVSGHAGMSARYAGTEWMQRGSIFLMQLFPAPVGEGLGVDLGAQLQLADIAKLSFAITDIGSIAWNREAREIVVNEDFRINDIGTAEQTEDIKRRLNGGEREIPSFSTSLPTAVTVAGSFAVQHPLGIRRPLLLAASLRAGLNEVAGNALTPRIGVGAEWEVIEAVVLRAGGGFGGNQPSLLGVGVGLKMDSFTLDVATHHIQSIMSDAFDTISLAVSGRLDF